MIVLLYVRQKLLTKIFWFAAESMPCSSGVELSSRKVSCLLAPFILGLFLQFFSSCLIIVRILFSLTLCTFQALTYWNPRQKSSHFVDSNEMKPFTSSMEMDTSSNHSSPLHLRQNLGRSMFLKRSRHWYGHQNSWRNSGAHMSATTSHGKTPPSWEERLNFKLASRYNSDNWQYSG